MSKRHTRTVGRFDDEHFCRCGDSCCVDEFTGLCLCRRCACHRNRKVGSAVPNSTTYKGTYSRSYEVGVDPLGMSLPPRTVEDMPARGEFVD
ncbi:hypothetical protein ACFY2Z_28425 [Streptomyces sp. NPDC001222]|uniref:hypothetical protein n=1 Tax=Streptomyces sp. NPDC001222 TaxID=3364548 RepID=UPI00368E1AF3